MNSVVTNKKKDGDELTFTISGLNVSFVNAIRRTIVSDIPIAVFKTFPYDESDCVIHKNTTRFNNEILKQRLSCIPILIDVDDKPIKNLVLKVKHANNTTETQYLTTKQFNIYDESTKQYLPDSLRDSIFPANNISKNYIDFVRLRPGYFQPNNTKTIIGEEIDFECKMSLGMANMNAMFNVVSMVAFSNTTVPKEQLDVHFENYKNSTKKENLSTNEQDIAEADWFVLNAKRHFIPDSFDFKMNTICVYDCEHLLSKAITIIINKFKVLIDPSLHNPYNISTQISKNNTFYQNCYDIVLQNESYTIGKIIEHVLFSECVEAEVPTMSFVSFLKEHPHFSYSIIRVVFVDDTTEQEVIELLHEKFQHIIQIYEHIKGIMVG
tara:strand:+ start:407 stop:1549 length:1143 start_codon:yes stop_codon:yes gene_type:complete